MNYRIIKELLLINPESLAQFPKQLYKDVAKSILPYSTGIEFECDKAENYSEDFFISIPNIMNVNTDNLEQRYRIPSGYDGILCLYRIMELMKIYSIKYDDGGIHFHVDCTDFDKRILKERANENINKILSVLDTWNYTGGQSRGIVDDNYSYAGNNTDQKIFSIQGTWIKFNSLNTMEFRCVDQTFHFFELFPKIVQAQEIVKKLKLNKFNTKKEIHTIINNRVKYL